MNQYSFFKSSRFSVFFQKTRFCSLQNICSFFWNLSKIALQNVRVCQTVCKFFLNLKRQLSYDRLKRALGIASSVLMGLHMEDDAVYVVEFSKEGGYHWAESGLPVGMIIHGQIHDTTALAQHLKQLLNQGEFGQSSLSNKFSEKKAVIAIPDELVLTKVIEMQRSLDEESMELSVLLEASRSLSLSAHQIYIDFQVLEKEAGCSSELQTVKVRLIACAASYVQDRVKVVREAGLQVIAAERASDAFERAKLNPSRVGRKVDASLGLLTAYGLAQKCIES